MRTDIAIDKLCDICPIIADISEKASTDTELKALLVATKGGGKAGTLRLIPAIKNKCEDELYKILSILYNSTPEEIKAQSFAVTLKQIIDLFDDEDFKGFFSLYFGNTEPEKLAET